MRRGWGKERLETKRVAFTSGRQPAGTSSSNLESAMNSSRPVDGTRIMEAASFWPTSTSSDNPQGIDRDQIGTRSEWGGVGLPFTIRGYHLPFGVTIYRSKLQFTARGYHLPFGETPSK